MFNLASNPFGTGKREYYNGKANTKIAAFIYRGRSEKAKIAAYLLRK